MGIDQEPNVEQVQEPVAPEEAQAIPAEVVAEQVSIDVHDEMTPVDMAPEVSKSVVRVRRKMPKSWLPPIRGRMNFTLLMIGTAIIMGLTIFAFHYLKLNGSSPKLPNFTPKAFPTLQDRVDQEQKKKTDAVEDAIVRIQESNAIADFVVTNGTYILGGITALSVMGAMCPIPLPGVCKNLSTGCCQALFTHAGGLSAMMLLIQLAMTKFKERMW